MHLKKQIYAGGERPREKISITIIILRQKQTLILILIGSSCMSLMQLQVAEPWPYPSLQYNQSCICGLHQQLLFPFFQIIGAIVQFKKSTQRKSQNVKQLVSRNPQVFRPRLFSNWEFWLEEHYLIWTVFRKVDRYIFAWLNLHWIQDNESVSELPRPEAVVFVTHANDEHCQLICKNSALNLNEMYLWKKICRMHQLGRNLLHL